MSQKTRSQFKVIFSQGNIPTQEDFHDFIDSFWNLQDDGSFTGITGPTGPAGNNGYGYYWSSISTQTTSTYTASDGEFIIVNTPNHITTLPAPSGLSRVGVKMINPTVGSVEVRTNTSGVTIDGIDRSSIGLSITNQNDSYIFVCDGSNWFIESSNL